MGKGVTAVDVVIPYEIHHGFTSFLMKFTMVYFIPCEIYHGFTTVCSVTLA